MMRQQHALPLPVKELARQLFLKAADRMADRGLGEMQGTARLGKTSLTGQDSEGAELPGIEKGLFHL
jgi:hypothetical protein